MHVFQDFFFLTGVDLAFPVIVDAGDHRRSFKCRELADNIWTCLCTLKTRETSQASVARIVEGHDL